jgi:hypothetical protein
MQSKQAIYTANTAKAKIVYNKEKEVYTIICAFNVTEKTDKGAYKFPPRAKCDFVSGDFVWETIQKDKERIISTAKQTMRTDNIEFV